MKLIATFCPPDPLKPLCPQLFIDSEATPDQRVVIRDDFNHEIRMHPDQFTEIINQAESVQRALDS